MIKVAKIRYQTRGVCSRAINVEVEDGIVKSVEFEGGCNGNTKGVASLVEGMEVDIAIAKLEGITGGFKGTSCPYQLAQAPKKLSEEE